MTHDESDKVIYTMNWLVMDFILVGVIMGV